MNNLEKLATGLCTLGEIVCIGLLAAIGLKRNNDCYKAEMKLIEREADLAFSTINIMEKDAEIEKLKKELDDIKSQKES